MSKRKKRMTRAEKQDVTAIAEVPTFFDSPESSLIKRAEYSPDARQMVIHFAAGTVYDYSGIDSQLWEDFTTARSKGVFFGKVIRPMFAGKPRTV